MRINSCRGENSPQKLKNGKKERKRKQKRSKEYDARMVELCKGLRKVS